MTVSAVGQRDHSHLNTIIRSTAVGTAAGYAAKYLWPVTEQEATLSDKKGLLNYCRKYTNRAIAREYRGNKDITVAQDAFVKMVDANEKDAFKTEKLAQKVLALGGEDSKHGKEFRGIIRNVNESSNQAFRRWFIAYKHTLKKVRPVVPFLVTGAGIGFLTGFTHNVLKTDA